MKPTMGRLVPFGVYPVRAASFRMARKYAGWIALAYAIIGREDQADEIMSCMRAAHAGRALRYGPRKRETPDL
jgi:hypothetical protein